MTYRGHHTDSPGLQALVECVAWEPTGTRIASGGGDFTAQVWDATTGNTLLTYREHQMVKGIAWSPAGTRIASASDDLTAQVWDATTGNTQLIYRGYTDQAGSTVTWSPDGTRIALTGASGDISGLFIWQVDQ
jgi:WD40 repeat protein